jgi:hypothetical protein
MPTPRPQGESPEARLNEIFSSAQEAIRQNREDYTIIRPAPQMPSQTAPPFVDFTDDEEESEPVELHCSYCGTQPADDSEWDDFNWLEGANCLACNDCYAQRTFVCPQCSDVFPNHAGRNTEMVGIDPRTGKKRTTYVCEKCAHEIFECCEHCGTMYGKDSKEWKESINGYCKRCVKNYSNIDHVPCRNYEEPTYEGDNIPSIFTSMRRFGIEIEAHAAKPRGWGLAYIMLPKEVGLGTDSSVGNMGVEFRTAPISGRGAEETIQKTCKVLNDLKYTTSKTCGFHIHVSVEDIDSQSSDYAFSNMRDLWLFYLTFEDVILSFLPPSRRNNYQYCAPLKTEYHFKEVHDAQNIDALEKLWYRLGSTESVTRAKSEHRHASRYRGINLHPMFSSRHFEIRYHSGTLNARKMLEWTNLQLKIVDTIITRGFNMSWAFQNASSTNIEEKTREFFKYLQLSKPSVAYFMARQQAFYTPPTVEKDEHYEIAKELLDNEREH